MTVLPDPKPLPYATPVATTTNKTWAAVAITFAGLGMAVIGGCFLIGVMLTNDGYSPLASQSAIVAQMSNNRVLLVVLYIAAIISFVASGVLIISGVRALLAIVRS